MDLSPGNIILTEEGEVQAVIDWESAASYPPFWMPTKTMISLAFVDFDGKISCDWRDHLVDALSDRGIHADEDMIRA